MKQAELYIAEAFMAAGGFFDIKFFEDDSEGIDILQSKFFIVVPEDKDWRLDPQTWDPSAWSDWTEAVQKTLNKKKINLEKDRVTTKQAYLIMKEFVRAFAYEYNFKDLIELHKEINQDESIGFYESKQWRQWLFCIDAILSCMITNRGSLYDLHATIFTQQQAYEIMQKFLTNFCLEMKQMKEVEFLLKIDFYQQWEKVYDQASNGKVTLVQAYNIMLQFLIEWAYQNLDKNQAQTFLEQFEVDEDEIPVDYPFFYYWIREANVVLINI